MRASEIYVIVSNILTTHLYLRVIFFHNFAEDELKKKLPQFFDTLQTQIRLLLEEQSDQGLHCLPFLHRLDSLLYGKSHILQILEWLQQMFWVYEYLGSLR